MTKAIETAVKILEALPEPTQENLVEELRRLALEAKDDAEWDKQFSKSKGLKAAAQKVRKAVAEGKAEDMDFERL